MPEKKQDKICSECDSLMKYCSECGVSHHIDSFKEEHLEFIESRKQKKKEKKYDWTHAYLQDPLKEFKKPRKNHTDDATIERWRRINKQKYRPKDD